MYYTIHGQLLVNEAENFLRLYFTTYQKKAKEVEMIIFTHTTINPYLKHTSISQALY
jgi:hypothetical protein